MDLILIIIVLLLLLEMVAAIRAVAPVAGFGIGGILLVIPIAICCWAVGDLDA